MSALRLNTAGDILKIGLFVRLLLEKVIFLGVVTQRLYVDPQHSRQNTAFACEQLRELLCTVGAGIYWNIRQCLQFDPSDSYCCEAAFPVQIDGFRALMDNAAFARYISGRSVHIEPSKELKTEYLEEWSFDCPDVTHIKEICRKAIGDNERSAFIVAFRRFSFVYVIETQLPLNRQPGFSTDCILHRKMEDFFVDNIHRCAGSALVSRQSLASQSKKGYTGTI